MSSSYSVSYAPPSLESIVSSISRPSSTTNSSVTGKGYIGVSRIEEVETNSGTGNNSSEFSGKQVDDSTVSL